MSAAFIKMVIDDYKANVHILKDVIANPFLSIWQRSAIDAIIKDSENMIIRLNTQLKRGTV